MPFFSKYRESRAALARMNAAVVNTSTAAGSIRRWSVVRNVVPVVVSPPIKLPFGKAEARRVFVKAPERPDGLHIEHGVCQF